jgi:crotonobetainyl-CoA:carnitine CoA-transferase CaiB-like acyl-CoA transferase
VLGALAPLETIGAPPAAESGRPPLEGVTILEFATIIAAPLAASLLSDLGARVIKVEPIGGDPGRRAGGNIIAGLGSIKFNAGKESICIDLKSPEGQQILAQLLPSADVILHNYRPGVPERLGIGYEQVRAVNPNIIWVSANGYGPDAPGAHRPCAHPIAGAAAGGALYQAGVAMPPSDASDIAELREAARWMMRANEVNPDPNTSMVIASATLLGLYAARRSGIGQRIFVNMLCANAYANHNDALAYKGKAERPGIDADLYGLGATHRLYRASESWVFLAVARDEEWAALRDAVADATLDSPAFATAAGRAEHDARLSEVLTVVFATRGADAWEELLIHAGVGCVRADASAPGPFFLSDPHVHANGFAATVEHPRFGSFVRHGPTVTLARSGTDCGPGSLAGLQTDDLLADLGFDVAKVADLRQRSVVWSEAVEVPGTA